MSHADYSVDKIKKAPTELKGNSAEGVPVEMNGFGVHSALEREFSEEHDEGKGGGNDAPGAFIQGH